MLIIMAVAMIIGIVLFSLNVQSRETFFQIHYYYLDSAREQLVKSIHTEAHEWLKREMSSSSLIKTAMLEKIRKYEDFTLDLQSMPYQAAITNSMVIAEFAGFDVQAKMHFRNLRPFFGVPESTTYDSDGLIFPNQKECHGSFVIEVGVYKEGTSGKTYEAWHNFRFINLLPPALGRFSFFLKNQDQDHGFPGRINALPMEVNREENLFRRGIIETKQSSVRPLVIINSLKDYDPTGQAASSLNSQTKVQSNLRSFDASNAMEDLESKGWVFLGTEQPRGMILNLAGFNAFHFVKGARTDVYPKVPAAGSLYYGDYFHRGLTQSFVFTTRNPAGPPGPGSIFGSALDPTPYGLTVPLDSNSHFRIEYTLKNYQSMQKSMTYASTSDPKMLKRQNRLKNYFNSPASAIPGEGFDELSDYRSQHPALIKPMGEYYYSKSPELFFDNRSPTLVLGPIRRSYMTHSTIRQESGHDLLPPDFEHRGQPKPARLVVPYFNIKDDGTINPDHNNGSNLVYEDPPLGKEEGDPEGGTTPGLYRYIMWSIFPSPVEHIIDNSYKALLYYRDYLMSQVWFDSYLHSFNSMVTNGGMLGEFHAPNSLDIKNLKSLQSTSGTLGAYEFFYSEEGEAFNGNRLHIKEFSIQDSSHERTIFKGKLGSLELFSPSFQFNPLSGEMSAPTLDLRLKATHLTDAFGFQSSMIDTSENTRCVLELNGILYIHSEPTDVLELQCPNGPLVVRGKGILIHDGDIHIKSSIEMEGADSFNSTRNKKEGSQNPFELIDIPPFTLSSAMGNIRIGKEATHIQAYLVALDSKNGTVGFVSGPPDQDLFIIGGMALHHLDLDQVNLQEEAMINGAVGADVIKVPQSHIFHRSSESRIRLIFNNSFIPTVKENVDQYYAFITSKGVYLDQ